MILAALLLFQAAAPAADTVSPQRSAAAMKAPREYEGVWLDSFEGQEFFDGASGIPDLRVKTTNVWLSVDRARVFFDAKMHERTAEIMTPRFFRVRFIGEEAKDMDCHGDLRRGPDPGCYGHMGAYTGLVVAKRVLSIEDLGPLKSSSDNQH